MENTLKMNMYVDGNYAYHICQYIGTQIDTNFRSIINWDKLVAYLTGYVTRERGARCVANIKKYVIGTGGDFDSERQQFYNAIEYAGIQRISFPLNSIMSPTGKMGLKEDAVDSLLTFTAARDFYSVSKDDRPDVVCLFAGDSDFIPLIDGLQTEGVTILLLYFDFISRQKVTRASQMLLEKANWVINLEQLLKERVDENAKAIFTRTGAPAHQPVYTGNTNQTYPQSFTISLETLKKAVDITVPDADGYVLGSRLGKSLEIVLGAKLPPWCKIRQIANQYPEDILTDEIPAFRIKIKK